MVPGCGSSACVTQLGGGFHGPHGVAVDSSGSVYVVDTFNNAVKRMPPGCGSENCVTTIAGDLHYPYGLALDGSGNVFVAENSNNAIQEILLAAPSALSFATPTTDGTNDTTDTPQAETVWNNGNAPLILDSPTPSISAAFALGSESTSCDQLSNLTLPAGQGCTLTATFAPVAPDSGTVSGTITLTDNALNAANAGQSISLSGTAVLPPPVPSLGAAFANSNPLNLGASESFSVSMTNPSSTVAISSFWLTLQLPAGLQVVAGSLGGSCTGGLVTYAPSSSTIQHTGLSLAAGANCQDSFTLKATGLGAQTVTATVASGEQVASASPQVSVVDVATSLSISVPSSAYLGGSSHVTVTALDSFGNPDLAYTGTVSFTSTDAAATLPANYTFIATNAGTHTFTATLNSAGNQTITATDASDGLAITSSSIAVSAPNLVVTTAQDDAGAATNCTAQTTPGAGTDVACSLRDALAQSAALGSANITFDKTAFSAANTAAQNTITLGAAGTLQAPGNTSITGPFSGSGSTLATLVTLSGNNQYGVIQVSSGIVALTGLSIVNGSAGAGGGVNNNGALTVTNCNIANNQASSGYGDQASSGYGGGIFNTGKLTIAQSVFTGNTAINGGGGVGNFGSLTVLASTLQGNSSQTAGGLYVARGNSANVIGATITGNNAKVAGGTENLGSLALTNTIVSGNSASKSNADTFGGFTDNGGNIISTSGNLSVLGSYGGPTQTILPLPGSVAICAGTLAGATAAGMTTDQRGYEVNPNCPTGTIDAGAAQTNYALRFTTSPGSVATGQTLSPAPIVTVTESGVPLTAGAASVSLADRSGTLSGTTSGSTSTTNGQATFSSLTVGAAITNDVLMATLPLNPGLTPALALTATSNSFAINQTTPVVTWTTPAAITYGTALSAAQLNAAASVPGSFAYYPAATTVLGAGSQSLSVKFTPASSNYAPVTKMVTLLVNQATPVVTWATPAPITYGTALSATQLNATATVPGSFAYLPAATTVVGAGSQTLSVKFTPSDCTDYASVTKTVTLLVNQVTPVVTWATPAPITYGTALSATQLNATATVPGSFAYLPAATTVLSAGSKTLSVKFTPANTNYPSVTKTVTLLVNQAAPMVKWSAPAAITYGTPLSTTQLDAIVSVPGTIRYAPTAGTVLAAGLQRISLIFTPTDSVDYKFAANSEMLTVKQATTTTTLSIATMQTPGGTTAAITPTVKPQIGGSPTGTLTYLNGSTVIGSAAVGAVFTTPVLPVGTDKISAVYHGDSNFLTSTSVQTSITGVAATTVDFTLVCTKLIYPQAEVYGVVVPLVSGKAITGSITVFDGTVAISSTPIPARGILVGITLPPLKVGTHILTAVYSGGNYPPGQSAPQTVVVTSK